jgi:hypothetical protein
MEVATTSGCGLLTDARSFQNNSQAYGLEMVQFRCLLLWRQGRVGIRI